MREQPVADFDLDEEPLPKANNELISVGMDAPDFEAILTSSHPVRLSELARRGPVLLNFIKGTWCPFCQRHLMTLRSWQESLRRKRTTILVLSNEGIDSLRAWLSQNSMSYLFASPVGAVSVFRGYGVDVERESFARPATFLIDTNLKVLMAYAGPRGTRLTDSCEQCGLEVRGS